MRLDWQPNNGLKWHVILKFSTFDSGKKGSLQKLWDGSPGLYSLDHTCMPKKAAWCLPLSILHAVRGCGIEWHCQTGEKSVMRRFLCQSWQEARCHNKLSKAFTVWRQWISSINIYFFIYFFKYCPSFNELSGVSRVLSPPLCPHNHPVR